MKKVRFRTVPIRLLYTVCTPVTVIVGEVVGLVCSGQSEWLDWFALANQTAMSSDIDEDCEANIYTHLG